VEVEERTVVAQGEVDVAACGAGNRVVCGCQRVQERVLFAAVRLSGTSVLGVRDEERPSAIARESAPVAVDRVQGFRRETLERITPQLCDRTERMDLRHRRTFIATDVARPCGRRQRRA